MARLRRSSEPFDHTATRGAFVRDALHHIGGETRRRIGIGQTAQQGDRLALLAQLARAHVALAEVGVDARKFVGSEVALEVIAQAVEDVAAHDAAPSASRPT
jgi:hypothetical protein